MALVVEVSAWVPHSSQAAAASNFSKNIPHSQARRARVAVPCSLRRLPSAAAREGPLRRGGRERHAVARGCQAGGSQAAFATRTGARQQKVAGLTELVRALRAGFSGPGRSPRWQWLLGRASCLALRSCRRQRYEDGARGAGAIHVSVLVSSSRTYAHRMCSLARAKTKPLTYWWADVEP